MASSQEQVENRKGKPRPAVLRALGKQEPPAVLVIDGVRCRRVDTYKHDSWAATALYRPCDPTGPQGEPHPNAAPQPHDGRSFATDPPAEGRAGDLVCKLNRIQPIGPLSMRWLGVGLADREKRAMSSLREVPGFATPCASVTDCAGRVLRHAAAHRYVPGRPLRFEQRTPDGFFETLSEMVEAIHVRDMAFVDLNKRENIIVGVDGRPHLIDFQIHYRWPHFWPLAGWLGGWLLRLLQRADRYHLHKHHFYCRPDQVPVLRVPWFIRLHRALAVPFHRVRRRLLVLLGVRKGEGLASSEDSPEAAVRLEELASDPKPADKKAAGQANSQAIRHRAGQAAAPPQHP